MNILLVFSAFLITLIDAQNESVTCNKIKCIIDKTNHTGNFITYEIPPVTLPRLTSNICTTLPNLNEIDVLFGFLDEVDEDAFVPCKDIKEINLNFNNIIELKPNTLNRNPTLESVAMAYNRIQRIDEDLFANLTKLRFIDLKHNNISYFPATAARYLKELSYLFLENNQILDLDTKVMLEYFPNLVEITLRENDFECGRLHEIIRDLSVKNVEIPLYRSAVGMEIRWYKVRQIEKIECVDMTQWVILITTRHFQSELTNLSDGIYETKNELEVVQNKAGTIKEEFYQIISKNTQDILSLHSLKEVLFKVVDGLATNTSDLSKLLTKVEITYNVLSKQVSENRLKIESISTNVDSKLIHHQGNLSSMVVTIDENQKKNEGLILENWKYIIVLSVVLVVTFVLVGIMLIVRFYNQMLVVRQEMAEMKSILNGDCDVDVGTNHRYERIRYLRTININS